MIDRVPPPRGHFYLEVYDQGCLVQVVDEGNLIVNKSKTILLRLLSGDSAYAVTKIGFGVNGQKPVVGNTALQGAFVKALGSASFPNGKTVSFAYTLEASEAIGKPIAEFGLLSGNGLLFARKVSAKTIVKTDSLSFVGRWDIIF